MDLQELEEAWTEDVVTLVTERFERRLAEELGRLRAEFTKELHEGLSGLRREIADMRVEILRWSFLFWLGQISVMALMLSWFARNLGR